MRLIATVAALALATPALAESHLTDAEREAFRAEVRAYLLDNPEVLTEAIGVLQQREAEAQAMAEVQMLSQYRDALVNDGHSFVDGNPDGDITIVEFMDYRCGYCKRAFPEVASLLEEDGNIRLVVKEYPILGDASVLASRFAIATKQVAGDDAYADVHDTLMELQGNIDMDTLTRLSDQLGLDTAAITAEMDSDAVSEILAMNAELGMALQVNGTPTFVIGDRVVRGYVPQSDLARMVEDERG